MMKILSGIPFTIKNESAQPWVQLAQPNSTSQANATGHGKIQARGCGGPTPDNPSKFWYESIVHDGQSSFMYSSYKANYKVFRNVVTDFGADNTGATDASAAIQRAINGKFYALLFHLLNAIANARCDSGSFKRPSPDI
jgi:glucan 1,3-beta-glucosidase